jgi:hypothetical protein
VIYLSAASVFIKETGVKRFVLALIGVIAIGAFSSAAALADPPNLSGQWTVQQTGSNGTTASTIALTQSGMGVVGNNDANKNGFNGTFVTDSKMNGKWHGPSGAGWLTVYASPNGHSFNGTWGYNGRSANGSFVGNKVLPPAKITAAGTWEVVAVGGSHVFGGPLYCTQSGAATVCRVNNVIINGKFTTPDKVTATWHGPLGSGWYSYWFNDDGKSFNGVWGFKGKTKPAGRVVGQQA